MPPISVFLVESSAMFLRGLRSYLEEEPDIEVVGAAHCGEDALIQAARLQPQVAMVDLYLKWKPAEIEPSAADGVRLVTMLNQVAHPPAVLVFADSFVEGWLEPLANAGAHGCLHKEDEPAVMLSAVRAAAAGMSVWTPSQLALLRSHPLDCLSCREQEVLALIAQGCTNWEVGQHLGVTAGAVNKHVEHIFAKLGAHTRTQAVRVARERGLIKE